MKGMAAHRLGTNGPRVSIVGLGCNNFGRAGTATEDIAGTCGVIRAAQDAGITLLDTADNYGTAFGRSEELIGLVLGKGGRDDFVLATKFGYNSVHNTLLPGVPRGSRQYVRAAVEGSLRRLQTDWIDLYQQHWPDPSTPIEVTIGALEELATEGKILSYGHSNFSSGQIEEAAAAGRFVSAQSEYNLLARDAEDSILPVAAEADLGFLPFFPLANGLLTGKYRRGRLPADSRIARQGGGLALNVPWDRLERYAKWSAAHGVTPLEATIGWLLAQTPVASVIAGATRPEQVQANARAALWTPTAEEVREIGEIFPRSSAQQRC